MKHHVVAVIPLCLCLFAPPAGAQVSRQAPAPAPAKSKPAPRTPDGKPDLSGFWQGPLLRTMFESVGGPPLTPEGQKAYEYNLNQSVNPEGLCLFAGIPRASISGVPFEIVQNANRVAFLYELMSTWRSIPVDGRSHPRRVDPSYFGNGIGSWDGDTLVIDSVGFKDRLSWVDDDAHPHSDAMHVIERWRRIDQDHLDHTVWVEDPKFYTKPWTFHRVFTHMPAGQEVMEYACDENNLDRDSGRLGFGPHEPSKYPGVQ
jgi:hypothetical protein